jgi:UDP-N-acetylmuramate--alanine ligase
MRDVLLRSRLTDGRAQQVEQTYAGQRIHMVGIGGAGMRALAEMLIQRGACITGSDLAPSAATLRLSELGADVAIGQQGENIPLQCDRVVFSAAVHAENPELVAATERGLKGLKYSQMLGEIMSKGCGVGIAGTHGKSTTTAMVAYALTAAGTDPSFIIGATCPQLGGPSHAGAGKLFVAEACEFDRSFLNLQPTYAAVLNIEEDHLDCYKDLDSIVEAFRSFIAKLPVDGVAIVNGEDRTAALAARGARCEVQTFGLADGCLWQAKELECRQGIYRFAVHHLGREFTRIELTVPGLHNVYNALAAAAILHHCGLSPREIASGLGGFSGTLRRMTVKAQSKGITVVDDYAHHPTEIQVTLKALRERFNPRKLVCVFEPHQHSRTRFLLKDFSRSFSCADLVIVPDIFFVRDSVREKDYISSQDLAAQIRLQGGQAMYLKTFAEIAQHLKGSLSEGDLVVTMGAGNVWEIADEVVRWLGIDR